MHTIRDASKDKPFELEMAWLCAANDYKHTIVPADILAAAEAAAKAGLESAEAMDTA